MQWYRQTGRMRHDTNHHKQEFYLSDAAKIHAFGQLSPEASESGNYAD